MKRWLTPLLIILVSGCSTPKKNSSVGEVYDVSATQTAETIDMTLMLAQQRAMDRLGAQKPAEEVEPVEVEEPKKPKIEYVLNTKSDHPKVQKWIKYYTVKDRERFQRFLNRGARYKQIVQDLFVTNGLPPDLYYLGILESGYVGDAISRAGAVGPWQFMGPTGREYGLAINNYVDERVDPIRATLAASRYLKELYRQKKSWYLALAAYNAGPGRVKRAMRKARRRGRATNYWTLTRRRLLPYDTREYIPQFLAILYIGKNLEKFDFVEKIQEPLPRMELVKVPSPVHLKKVAKITGLSQKRLKKLNPQLVRGMTPPGKKHYHIWVDKQHIETVESQFSEIAKHRVKGLKVRRYVASSSRRRSVHKVRAGQNLSKIARRYGVSVRQIKRWNRLRSSRIYVGQRLKVRKPRVGRTSLPKRRTAYHKVRRGQNLSSVARRYGMTVRQVKRLNGLKRSKILVGQRLKVYSKKSKSSKQRRYRIRRGDNLTKIARKFGLTVRQIKKMNRLKSNKIKRGQYLVVSR